MSVFEGFLRASLSEFSEAEREWYFGSMPAGPRQQVEKSIEGNCAGASHDVVIAVWEGREDEHVYIFFDQVSFDG